MKTWGIGKFIYWSDLHSPSSIRKNFMLALEINLFRKKKLEARLISIQSMQRMDIGYRLINLQGEISRQFCCLLIWTSFSGLSSWKGWGIPLFKSAASITLS